MAGTRLMIQGVAVIECLALIAVAVYFGLYQCHDVMFASYHSSSGRSLLSGLYVPNANHPVIDAPRLSIVVDSASDVAAWKAAYTKRSKRMAARHDFVTFHDDDHEMLAIMCQKVKEADDNDNDDDTKSSSRRAIHNKKEHRLWICPTAAPPISSQKTDIVARIEVDPSSGTAVVFPFHTNNDALRVELLVEALLLPTLDPATRSIVDQKPMKPPPRRKSLKVQLVVQDTAEWQPWASALSELLETIPNLPCLDGTVSTHLDLGLHHDHLSSLSKTPVLMESTNEALVHEISVGDARRMLVQPEKGAATARTSTGPAASLGITIYVPSRDNMPLMVVRDEEDTDTNTVKNGTRSLAFSIDSDIVSFVGTIPRNKEPQESYTVAMQQALSRAVPFLEKECSFLSMTGHSDDNDYNNNKMPPYSLDGSIQVEPLGALPLVLFAIDRQVVTHYILMSTYQQARDELDQLRIFLMGSNDPSSILVTKDIALEFIEALRSLNIGLEQAKLGQWEMALDAFETAIQQVTRIRDDPAIMEPQEFPLEQYAAVLAPMLLPMATALIGGLFREAKRYQKLKHLKQTA